MSQRHKVFKFERSDNVLIVFPQGKDAGFRYADIHLESNSIVRLLDDPAITHLVIDFDSIDYASSIVIGALIRMSRKVSDEGGKAAFCSASKRMQEILATMNLFKLWPYYKTKEEAITALNAESAE